MPHVNESNAIIDKQAPINSPVHRFSLAFVQVENSNIAFSRLFTYDVKKFIKVSDCLSKSTIDCRIRSKMDGQTG